MGPGGVQWQQPGAAPLFGLVADYGRYPCSQEMNTDESSAMVAVDAPSSEIRAIRVRGVYEVK